MCVCVCVCTRARESMCVSKRMYVSRDLMLTPASIGRSDAVDFYPFVSNSFWGGGSIKPQF